MAGMKRGLALTAVALAFSTPAAAQEVEQEGVIISRSDDILNVRTRAGDLRVAVSPSTRIKENRSGLSGSRDRGPETLIPGLIIKAEGHQSGGTLTAEQIEYKERDWRAAIASRAGTQEQFAEAASERAELKRAIIEGNEYEVRQEATVYFATGSSAIAPQHSAAAARARPGGAGRRQLPDLDHRLRRPARQCGGERAAEPQAGDGGQQLPAPDRRHPAGPGALADGDGRGQSAARHGRADERRRSPPGGGAPGDSEDAADAVTRSTATIHLGAASTGPPPFHAEGLASSASTS